MNTMASGLDIKRDNHLVVGLIKEALSREISGAARRTMSVSVAWRHVLIFMMMIGLGVSIDNLLRDQGGRRSAVCGRSHGLALRCRWRL